MPLIKRILTLIGLGTVIGALLWLIDEQVYSISGPVWLLAGNGLVVVGWLLWSFSRLGRR